MTLGRKSILLVLVTLYIGAVWVRLDALHESVYPYYKDESGTNFRHTQMIADIGRLPVIDGRASRPEGYSPSRVTPAGAEYVTGYARRLVRPFIDFSDKEFSGILSILVFSLSVFTMYALARRVWDCQAAGSFAAFLIAFSAPLVAATNGKEYLHTPYAFVLVSLHLALFAGLAARPSVGRRMLTALTAFALWGTWGSAGLYVAVFALAVLILPKLALQTRRWVLASHLAAALLAGMAFPHLRAERFFFSWPVAWLVVATAYSFYRDKIPRRAPGWACLLGAFVALSFLLGLFRRGAGDLLDPLAYGYYRLRFIAGKPDDPALLPDIVRIVWTHDHAPPSARALLEFFLPLVFLLPPAMGVLRSLTRDRGVSPWPFAAAVGFGTAVFLVDRSMVFSAALFVFPFVSGAFSGFGRHLKTRALPAALALVLVMTGSPVVPSGIDVVRLIGTRLGVPSESSGRFMWASIGNADRELVRFLVTSTSTRNDIILAPPGISSLIVTFAGRSTVVVPGVPSRRMAGKTVEVLSGFYAGEDDLLERCRILGATYVLYSIDTFLDRSSYSPRYTAAAGGDIEKSLAYNMHFAPQTLRHFQLVYENDNYRLFRVTTDIKPVFLSDHPPVYQEGIFRASGGNVSVFYSRIIDVLAAYYMAVETQTKGDEDGAIRRFAYSLEQAPFFTAARLGLGDSLLRLRKPKEAYDAYGRVLEYAPDNTHALYYGALSLAYTGRRGEALRLVELLLTATAKRELRAEALELKAALESGRPIEMPRLESPENPK